MDPNKMHERVLEIQKNIQTASPEQQKEMLDEIINVVSQIEKSLSEIQIDVDIDDIQINEDEE
jgi:hypothetical protein